MEKKELLTAAVLTTALLFAGLFFTHTLINKRHASANQTSSSPATARTPVGAVVGAKQTLSTYTKSLHSYRSGDNAQKICDLLSLDGQQELRELGRMLPAVLAATSRKVRGRPAAPRPAPQSCAAAAATLGLVTQAIVSRGAPHGEAAFLANTLAAIGDARAQVVGATVTLQAKIKIRLSRKQSVSLTNGVYKLIFVRGHWLMDNIRGDSAATTNGGH